MKITKKILTIIGGVTCSFTLLASSPAAFATPPPSSPSLDCPATIRCIPAPAAHHLNDPANLEDYGNYDIANRPADATINTVVIHTTEGSLQSTLNEFQHNPTFYASSNYVVDQDGTVYEVVPPQNIAWHAGNWYTNMHSVGIEHIGYAKEGQFSSAMYRSSTELVKYLSNKYGIPLNRQHIIGHDNVPAPYNAAIATAHTDPGPFWNWQTYMGLLGKPSTPSGNPLTSSLVTIAPISPISQQPVTDCSTGSCITLPAKPTNFVNLHTAASESSPLLTDQATNQQGTTAVDNNAARAFYGQQFAVNNRNIGKDGIWYQVWYGGQLGWFYSPYKAITSFSATGKTITPKRGMTSIHVYGQAYPEATAYPTDFNRAPVVAPLAYTITAGQKYSIASSNVPTDYFFNGTIDNSLPYDHQGFQGVTKYIQIQFNGHAAYVRQSDVTVNG